MSPRGIMTPLVRFGVSVWTLLVLSALLKISNSECVSSVCTASTNETVTTTTIVSSQPCLLSIDNNTSGNTSSLTDLIPGTVYAIYFECQNCCKEVTTKPEAVRNLDITEVTTSSVVLSWTDSVGQSSFYRVQWTNGTSTWNKNVTDAKINISDLSAGVQYHFTVIAVAGDNKTESDVSKITLYTKPEAVSNLSITEVTTSSVFLSWTDSGGVNSFYRVQWTNGNSTWNKNVTESKINISELSAGVQYHFTVIAVARDDKTESDVSKITLYTKPEAVRNLNITEVTTSSVVLSWTDSVGQSSFYRVQWTNGTSTWDKNVSEAKINISELSAGVQYHFTVTAVAGDYKTESDASKVALYTKPEAVSNLSITEVTTSSVFLSWTDSGGVNSFYRVQWTNGNSTWNKNVTDAKINISDLSAGVQYHFTVIAVAGDNKTESDVSKITLYTKPEAVRNLNITEVTTSSVVLSWTDSVGQSSFYQVQWTNGTSTWDKNVSEAKINISELSAGVQYHFTVTAVAGDNKTESDASKVSLYTKPEAVRNLSITKVTTSSVFLSWTDSGGVSSFYRVQWTNGTSTWDENVTESKINISDLSAGVQYHFTVIAVAGDNKTESDVSKITLYTKPEAVRNLSITKVTTSSVFLSWTDSGGVSSFYRVQWTNGTSTWDENVTESKINISELSAGVQYHFTVIAVAGDNKTESDVSKVYQHTKPEVVKNITITEIATSFLSLTWIEPEGQRSFFKIHCIGRDKSQTLNVTETNVNISGLTPGIQYNISVTAVANDGLTEGQSITISQYTKPGKIQKPTRSTNTSSITLNWTLPFGDAVAYKVQVYGGPSPKTETETNEKSAVLRDLIPGTSYTITITALAGDNSRGEPCTFTAVTQPDTPTDIHVLAQGTDNLNITWILPQGKVDRFRVNISNDDINYSNSTVATTNITLLTGLQPGRLFVVTVSAELENFNSTSVQVSFATIPLPPDSINIHERTNSSLTLNWTSAAMDGAPNISYSVTYQSENSTVKTSVTSGNNITLDQLSSGTSYNITVETVGPQNLRSMAVHKSAFTLPNPVVALRASPKSTTSVEVNWSYPHGFQTYYRYFVKISNSGGTTINKTLSVNSAEVGELEPGTQYNISVKTVAAEGIESTAEETTSFTMPDAVNNLIVKDVTLTSVQLTWSRPNAYKPSYSYLVIALQNNMTVQNTYTATENHTFDDLNPGQLYTFQVFTVVEEVNSTMETVSTYTRPHPVSNLKKAGITPEELTLVWEQTESKPNYSYVVEASDGTNSLSYETKQITLTIPGLLSGSCYDFSVTTQTADGTQAPNAVTVSYCTPPFNVTQLKAETINTTTIRLDWQKPLQHKPEYRYRVETRGCTSTNKTFEAEVATLSGLPPGTECTFCVFVTVNNVEGKDVCVSQYTKPEAVLPSISSQGSNSSVLVTWTPPSGRVETYKVYLNDTSTAELNENQTSYLFERLSAGRLYSATVTTLSGPFNASSKPVTNATFPNPPGPIEILEKTTSSIKIRWEEAALMDDTSFQYRLTIMPSQGVTFFNPNINNHTFDSLLSGTSYNISILTVGVLDFQSEEVQYPMVTTKPFGVKNLRTSAEEKEITVEWDQPDEYKESYRYRLFGPSPYFMSSGNLTNNSFKVVDGLVPGTQYNFSVTTETSDGTRSDPRWISSCTNASKVINLTCQAPNESSAKLILSWKRPDGNHSGFRFTVNGTNTINSSTCCNQTVTDLSHHTEYDLTVETLSCGAPSIPVLKSCITGITDPPISPDSVKLVSTQDLLHDSFNIHIEPEMLNNINGPITHVGVLITEEDPADSSDWKTYLGKTYSQWKDKETPVYLATVIETSSTSRSVESSLNVKIGDSTQWHDYNNGPLDPNGKYQCSIVLFTSLSLTDNLVDSSTSLVSATDFIVQIVLPQNPATVIGIAVGATLGIFCFLFIILIGFIIYWKRLSNKETSDIQIHSMRSVAVRVEDYEAYYRKQKADSNCGFAEEFEDLKLVGTGQSKSNALMLENKPKNRYNNVLPYDSSRVKLSIIHGSPHDDYINANYMPGYNSRKEFIAAQGPLPATVSEFWRMIWEKNVQTLVMLTRCNEQGRVKCEQYWDLGTKHFDNITVTTVSEIPLEDWTIRDFDIKNVKTAETRSVRHFHFTAWPDHGVPETTELLISFRHLVREHMDQYSRHSPTVVHCSAGVGRTGTFICIDRLIAQIERENIVDVYGIVHDLRMHRPLMVQTEDQYVFLNQCAMDIIRSRTGTNVDLIYQNTAALSIYENVEPKKGYPKNGYHNA
ncbi:uncharacterized protein V6R79_005192 [Siganus canaliculatus]